MKIFYDHQIFVEQRTGGISRYFFELINQLSDMQDINAYLSLRHSHNQYVINLPGIYNHVYSANPILDDRLVSNIKRVIPLDIHELVYREEYFSMKNLMKIEPDVFHPTYYNPYFLQSLRNTPLVVTIHDMIHEIYPQFFGNRDHTIEWKKNLIQRADALIAVSDNTKKDICTFYEVDPDIITVIHHGCSIIPPNSEAAHKNTEKLLKSRYILYVGTRNYHKNFIPFLDIIKGLLKKNDYRLLCIGGGPFSQFEKTFIHAHSLSSNVFQISCSDEDLALFYANARAFIYPSLYEGFGMPILEAFACGCPAVLSNRSSLPEIGGDAAIYFDPLEKDTVKETIERVLYDDDLLTYLRKRGYERLSQFSWQKTALNTKKVYKKVLI